MGFFSTLINPSNVIFGGNSTLNKLEDPLDLSGNQAKNKQDQINAANQSSANASMKALQDAYDKIKVLYQPLEDAGKQGLAQLNSTGFAPSATYTQNLATGERDLGRKLRAMGRFHSTYGGRQLADFRTRAAQEEVDRQYAPTLSLLQTGSGAVNAISGAGNTFGNATDKTLANLGNSMFNSAQDYGLQRQNSMNNAASTLGSMAQFFNSK